MYYIGSVPYDSRYLEHYGVKGQKHGVRQWQNDDGSLTAAGREHYGYGDPRHPGAHQPVSNRQKISSSAAAAKRQESAKKMTDSIKKQTQTVSDPPKKQHGRLWNWVANDLNYSKKAIGATLKATLVATGGVALSAVTANPLFAKAGIGAATAYISVKSMTIPVSHAINETSILFTNKKAVGNKKPKNKD